MKVFTATTQPPSLNHAGVVPIQRQEASGGLHDPKPGQKAGGGTMALSGKSRHPHPVLPQSRGQAFLVHILDPHYSMNPSSLDSGTYERT